MLFIKLSVLHYYTMLFTGVHRSFSVACKVVMAVVTLYFVICTMIVVLRCIPISKSWDQSAPGACISGSERMVIPAAFNLIIEVFIIALPTRVIWRLRIDPSKRLLVLVFGAGWLLVTSNYI